MISPDTKESRQISITRRTPKVTTNTYIVVVGIFNILTNLNAQIIYIGTKLHYGLECTKTCKNISIG